MNSESMNTDSFLENCPSKFDLEFHSGAGERNSRGMLQRQSDLSELSCFDRQDEAAIK